SGVRSSHAPRAQARHGARGGSRGGPSRRAGEKGGAVQGANRRGGRGHGGKARGGAPKGSAAAGTAADRAAGPAAEPGGEHGPPPQGCGGDRGKADPRGAFWPPSGDPSPPAPHPHVVRPRSEACCGIRHRPHLPARRAAGRGRVGRGRGG
ncbi:hypothetical protein T484DRAFT_1890422, partial [Baffinella frigidus]